MTETSNTITALRQVADIIALAGIPQGSAHISWYACDDDALRSIMATFPEANWQPKSHGDTEWLDGRLGNVNLTAFAVGPAPTPPRLTALFADGQVSA